ncbi:MAG: DNA polymerase III subunit beta [Chloroflexi bacterium 13_1_40CM_4_68_4]|nr:MAG: DNA polymerase III subunit beta [Chloroflexi bacterium 13_1_40CM_4_68_4]
MKVSVLQENLARGLQTVARGVATRSTLPILANVLLRTDDGRLKLTTTNLEIGVNAWIGAKIEDEGGITVPAKLFSDFVNSLPPGQVDLSLNVRTKTLHVQSASYEANIKGIDAEEFPPIPTIPDKPTTRVAQSVLRQMINEVAFVAATDDSRPVLTGVLTRLEGDEVTLVAADPYRLGIRHGALLSRVDPSIEVIIPARSLFELARVIADDDSPLDIAVTQNKSQVIFHAADVDLVTRLIEGQFPNYRQVIPASFSTRVVVERDELLKATKLASYFARDAANIVRLAVNPQDGAAPLVVSANAAEIGDNVSRVEASVEGNGVQIAFNARFLSEALASLTATEVALELGGALAPGVLKVVGEQSYLHVVMPLRIPT